MAKESVQKLAHRHGGPPPGYKWHVVVLSFVKKEVDRLLDSEDQRLHLRSVIAQLAMEDRPTSPDTVDVRSIEDFWEVREKGGPLGGKNVRVFFGLDGSNKSIVLLGMILKQNDGATPPGDRERVKRRWRKYNAGDFN